MIEKKGSYRRRCIASNAIDKKLGWRGTLEVTCPVGAHKVSLKDFIESENMCKNCFEVYAMDMEKLADERDAARSEHENYLMATL